VNGSSDALVELAGVTKSFPSDYGMGSWLGRIGKRSAARRRVLVDVDLSVRRGEIFGLLGPNGAGKTTLLKMLATLLLPDCGTIRVAGVDALAHPMDVKRRVGFSFSDERSFYYRLTARRNLAFFGVLADVPAARLAGRVEAVMDTVDLRDALDRPVKSFSSGMRQRLAVARALLADPDVLILDEPTRAVDPVHALGLRTLVRDELSRRMGKTVILSTNVLEEAWSICDRVAILAGGRVAALGTPAALAERYAERRRYAVVFEQLEPALADRLRAIEGVLSVAPLASAGGPSLVIDLELRGRAFAVLLGALAGNGSVVRTLHQLDDSLFDVFRATSEAARE
jgi:ABC-2 type transport system ATP-binding protein